MKYANRLFATLFAFSLLLLMSCGGGDDNPTPGDDDDNGNGGVPGEAISGTWEQGDIDGPAADQFTDFSITISTTDEPTELDYSTTNTEPLVFPEQGSFDLPADPNFTTGAQVTREDGVQVDVTLVGEDQIRLEFTIDSDSAVPTENSRVAQVAGQYTFLLDKRE